MSCKAVPYQIVEYYCCAHIDAHMLSERKIVNTNMFLPISFYICFG